MVLALELSEATVYFVTFTSVYCGPLFNVAVFKVFAHVTFSFGAPKTINSVLSYPH
jgi:hypothetical protein